YIKSESGSKVAERFAASGGGYGLVIPGENLAEARDRRITRGPWWGMPAANTLDRATAMLPKLLYERLDELGLDYSVLYTTIGFSLIGIEDEELRRASCRALNRMRADMTAGFGDRLTAACQGRTKSTSVAAVRVHQSARVGLASGRGSASGNSPSLVHGTPSSRAAIRESQSYPGSEAVDRH